MECGEAETDQTRRGGFSDGAESNSSFFDQIHPQPPQKKRFGAASCVSHLEGPFPYLAGLRRVEDVHSTRLNAVGFGPLVKGKSAFPSTPISIW